MYEITKRIGGLIMYIYEDGQGGYFFASLPNKQPAQFASKKEALDKVTLWYGYFKKQWTISEIK